MNSNEFINLEQRLSDLRVRLLPNEFDIFGNYSDAQQEHFRAYVLLCHAEIEHYFESICRRKAKHAVDNFIFHQTPSNIVSSLLAFVEWTFTDDRKDSKNKIDYRLNKKLNLYLNSVENNHGIREENIVNLLLPVGILISQLSTSILEDLSQFSKHRGLLAHTSSHNTLGSINMVNPEDEYITVSRIIIGIRDLDIALESLT